MRLLVVEDEQSLQEDIKKKLQHSGYEVDACGDGETASEYLAVEYYDLVLLDLNLPKIDGMTLLRNFREENQETPVLILSARSEINDKVEGLDAGANDYLVKPFAFEELLARVRVLLRKPEEMPKTCYTIADLEVHLDTHKVIRGKEEIRLSGKEFALLRYMVQNAGIVLSRDRLEQHLWNYDYMGSSNVIDVYIRYLRKKIDDGREKKLIHTVRGVGYVLKEEE